MTIDLKSIFTPFPVLTTPNLILRALTADDLQDLYAYASDPEIDRYTPWWHYTSLAEAQADLKRFLDEYEQYGLGAWGIEHRADHRLIGIINISPPHRYHRRTELGFTIARAYWGRGYATEAAGAVASFVFNKLHVARIEALCLPGNLASARVLQKIGMQYEGLLHNYQVWKDQPSDLQMYAVTNPDPQWESSGGDR